jgi:hypothetical protein
MQDLGICEDDDCCDAFHISDVDLIFENYEDIFGGPQGESALMFEDLEAACSSMDKVVSIADPSGCNNNSFLVGVSSSIVTQIRRANIMLDLAKHVFQIFILSNYSNSM